MKFNLLTSAFDSILPSGFTLPSCLIILGVAFALGFLTSLTYRFIKKKEGYSREFLTALVLLPMIVAMIIYFVRDNVAGGLSLAGIFALTRFRSEQKNTEDIVYLFLSVVLGLTTGLGYVLAACIVAVILYAVLFILYFSHYTEVNQKDMTLKILVPEDLNYEEIFVDVLETYCTSYYLKRVKTSDFGTLFEVTYYIRIKDIHQQKAMMDALRERNGNMNITLVVRRYDG